ncbi:MAG: DUF4263 domain-containing protein [Candidatus Stahlbacteria bacterium]|nr:DUF4263 domain-containing protein [Candidatus Stahlbacteria bacterium]
MSHNHTIVSTKSTSRYSAIGSDIVLRETKITRLFFRPIIVENLHDRKACVKGHFIFQRKNISGNWEDYNDFLLTKLKDSEWVKLELKAGEVLKLIDGFQKQREIFEQYGIVSGEAKFTIAQGDWENILTQLSQFENKEFILQALEKIKPEDIQNLNSVIRVGELKKAVEFWEGNKDNGIDFIYQNDLTQNTALIEIKIPLTKLVSEIYRGQPGTNDIYSISKELTGAINQILNYKDEFQKGFYELAGNNNRDFSLFNPKSILIIGSLEIENMNNGQLKSFELFRHSNKDVEIITYDELFNKIKIFMSVVDKH